MMDEIKVLPLLYNFIVWFSSKISQFPRKYKYTLGDRITNLVLDLLEQYIEAYYTGNANLKLEILYKNNLQIERLRFLIRLAHDFRLFSNQRFGYISGLIDEVGRMNGGWLKQLRNKP